MGKCIRKIIYSCTTSVMAALLCFLCFACGGITLNSIEASVAYVEYFAGDAFDPSTVTVDATYGDGSVRTVTGWTTDAPDVLSAGEVTITVTYTEGGKSASTSFALTVAEKDHEHVFGEEWKSEGDVHFHECSCGERIDEAEHIKSGITVTEEASCTTDGARKYECSVCGHTANEKIDALGHNYTVKHQDDTQHWKECSRCHELTEKTAHEFELVVDNVKSEWIEGDKFTFDGITANKECDCGYVSAVDAGSLSVDKDTIALTDGEITFGCGDMTAKVKITVAPRVMTGISVDETATKNIYELDETFGGGKLKLSYNNDTFETIDLTSDMVKDFAANKPGEKTLEVEYMGETCAYTIRIGYDADTKSYVLGADKGECKLQAEDETYVDLSQALLQNKATNKFENTAKNDNNEEYSNGAEGWSTSNLTKPGNKVIIKFYAKTAGKFKLGLRAQSCNKSGKADVAVNEVFKVKVNNVEKTVSGNIEKASLSGGNWRNMDHWTELKDIAGELDFVQGLNTVEFAYTGTKDGTGDLRFPNLDYFVIVLL